MFIIVMGHLFEKFAKKSSRKFAGLKIITTFAVY